MKEHPLEQGDKDKLKVFIQRLVESGFRFHPLTEEELRNMTADQLYIQLTVHEYIGSEFETCGSVLIEQMEHCALVYGIYLEKIHARLSMYDATSRKSWTLRELSWLSVKESYYLYVKHK